MKGHKDDLGLGASFIRGEGERAETVQLREEKVQGDLIHMDKYLMGGKEGEGARLFSVVPRNRVEGNSHKLKHMKFYLNTRKCLFFFLFTVKVVKH